MPVEDGQGDTDPSTTGNAPVYLFLKAGTFDPLSDPEPIPSWLERGSTHPLHVIQFDGPVQKSWRDTAEDAGVELLDYLPDFGYFAYIPRGNLDDVRAMEHLRYIGPAHVAYRVDPALWDPTLEAMELSITTWDGEGARRMARAVRELGGDVVLEDGTMLTAKLEPVLAIALASDPYMSVSWIEPYAAPELHLNNDAEVVKARQTNDGAYQRNNLAAWSYNPTADAFEGWTGENVTVAVVDTGLDETHPGFAGRIEHYYDYDNDGQSDEHGHGTHTAGIVLGDGAWKASDVGVDGKYAGIAPEAGLVVQDYLNAWISLNIVNRDASRSGASISSNSWGSGYTSYTSQSRAFDSYTRDADIWASGDQPITYSFSAGNYGAYGSYSVTAPANAKNVITVGATGNDRWGVSHNTVWSSSSRGPTLDERIKPDVVVPGAVVASAFSSDANPGDYYKPSDGQTSYVYASGTSMAAPGVAGAAAVLTQYLVEEKDMDDPSPALLKANLINGARPLTGYAYPGNVQGWGLVDLPRSMFDSGTYKVWRDDQSVSLDTSTGSDSVSHFFLVKGDHPLKATLVWTDEPASTSSSKNLVNDLDLELIGPSGKRYSGNYFDAGQSVVETNGDHDRTNNVEGFMLDDPADGIWTVNVKAYNIPSTAQDFALVLSGNVQKGHVDLNPASMSVTPRDVEEHHTARLTGVIKNLGNKVADVFEYKVEQVSPGGGVTVLGTGSVTDLADGGQTSLGWDFTGVRGTHTLRLTLDPENKVPESDERNNVLEIPYFFKGYGVDVVPERELSLSDPGTIVDINFTVRNLGNVVDDFKVAVAAPPSGWSAVLVADTFSLSAGGAAPVGVSVVPPVDALAGDTAEITFTATSVGNSTKTKSVTVRVEVDQVFGLELSAPVSHLRLFPGQDGNFSLMVRNTGNGQDRYEVVNPGDLEPGWWASITEPLIVLESRTEGAMALRLTAPDPSPADASMQFQLTVRSTRSGMTATVRLSAVVVQYYDNEYSVEQREVQGPVCTESSAPLTITNKGNGPVDYSLSSNAPASWEVAFDQSTITVDGYSDAQVDVSFKVPSDALAGTNTITISAMPSGGEELQFNLTFEVMQYYALNATVVSEAPVVTQGESFTVEVRLENMGNGVDRVKLLVPDLPPYWSFDIDIQEVDIAPFEHAVLSAIIHTTKSTDGGQYSVGFLARHGLPQTSVEATAGVTILTRPDIQVQDGLLHTSAVEVVSGDVLLVWLFVENAGQTAAGEVYVQFYVDGWPIGDPAYIPSLAPGEAENVSISWWANVTGPHEISVFVDSGKDVDETLEDNNLASTQVNVEALDFRTSPAVGPLLVAVAFLVGATWVARRRRRAA